MGRLFATTCLQASLLPCSLLELKADCLPNSWIDKIDGNLWPDLDEPGCLGWCGESWKLVSQLCGGLALVRARGNKRARMLNDAWPTPVVSKT